MLLVELLLSIANYHIAEIYYEKKYLCMSITQLCSHNKYSQIFNISTIGDTKNSNYLPKVLVVACLPCYSTLCGMLISLNHRWLINGSESAL